MTRLFFFLIFFSSQAVAIPGPDQLMPAYYRWNLRLTDDPRQASLDAEARLKQLDPDRDAVEWVQLKLFTINDSIMVTNELVTDYPMLQDFARRARRIGREDAALIAEFIEQDNRITLEKNADETLYRDNYLLHINKAKAGNFLWVASMLMRGMAFWEYNIGRMDLALTHGREALTLAQSYEKTPGLETLKVKNTLAIILEFLREREAAEKIYQEVLAAVGPKFRHARANVLYNYGLLLARSTDTERLLQSERLMREALATAEKLGKTSLQAICQKGLASSLSLLARYEESNRFLRLAIDGLDRSLDQVITIADAHRLMGNNYLQLKQWTRALAEFDKADIPELAKDKRFLATLVEYRASAYAGTGQMDRAYAEQKKAGELVLEIQKDDKAADMERIKSGLVLQLEEQRNELLNKENKLQKEQLEKAALISRISYAAIAVAFLVIGLLLFAVYEARKVRASHARIQLIREHIEEGILSIGPGFKTQADIAPAIQRLLTHEQPQGDIAPPIQRLLSPDQTQSHIAPAIQRLLAPERTQMDIFDQLLQRTQLGSDEQQTIRAALGACIGEDELAWDLNQGQLPHEWLMQDGSWLSCDWQPIYDAKKHIARILLVVRDITARRLLQENFEQAQSNADRFNRRVQEILRIETRRALTLLQELEGALPGINQNLMESFRLLHTLKGGARSLGFKELANCLHNCEDVIQGRDKQNEHRLQELNDCSKGYLDIVKNLGQVSRERDLDPQTLSLQQLVAQQVRGIKQQLVGQNIPVRLIEVTDRVVNWNQGLIDRLQKILGHALNNAIDHGFILPKARGETIPGEVRLKISASLDAQSRVELRVRDNGVGLDLQRLTALAKERGLEPENPADVLLIQGVTTAHRVSETSGRGVGLSAIQELVQERGGEMKIRANDEEQGAMLIAQLPLD